MVAGKHQTKKNRWLALHFPHLALDLGCAANEQADQGKPHAISDTLKGRQVIIDCNPAAERAGIEVGMPTSAALTLAGSLQLALREQRAEHDTLKRLAAWCYQYSSQLSVLNRHNSLLLEIGASQRLFGPAGALAERIRTEIRKLGYQVSTGIAPTPEAALLAGRHGLFIYSVAEIRRVIGRLDIDELALQTSQLQSLRTMGFRRTADIFRLPRKALTRRLGLSVSDYLDRLLGNRPDPRKTFHPPERFSAGMDVPETSQTGGLIFPLKRLLQELCGVLRAHDCGIQALQVRFQLDRGVQEIRLNMCESTRSDSRLMRLLRERLERLQLTRPVRHINLQARQFLPCTVTQSSLLQDAHDARAEGDSLVIERLQARLGKDAVMGINGREDHRPEHSWSLRELDEAPGYSARSNRPGWLLAEPKRCDISKYRLLSGPERIETGWWDGRDCRRDYYIVRDTSGGTLWAFHEYKPRPGWYLQGLFA